MESTLTIGERIEKIRKYYGYTQKVFAEKLGYQSNGIISNIISGRTQKPNYIIVEKILTTFPEIDAGWLMIGKGTMITPTLVQIYESNKILEKEIEELKEQVANVAQVIPTLVKKLTEN